MSANQPPGPTFNWDDFQKQLLGAVPFLPKQLFQNGGGAPGGAWVHDYVRDTMSQLFGEQAASFPFTSAAKKKSKLRYELFETHRSLIVRFPMPDGAGPSTLQSSVNRRTLRIRLPSGEMQDIALPKPVIPRSTEATIRDGILEIRMPKSSREDPYQDIPIG